MAKTHAPLLSFNSGEVSKFALPRVDLAQMRLAAEQQVNWTPTVLGPMMLRPGTKYLFSTRSDAKAKYIPFIFANDDTALIELTDLHMRIIVNDAVLTAASVSTAMTAGTFSASTSWTLSATSGASSTIDTVNGYLKLHARAVGSSAFAEQAVTVASGDQNVGHRLRIVVSRGPVEFQIGSSTGGEQYFAKTSLGTGTHSIAFTPTGATAYVRFSTNSKTTKWVDSIAVEAAGAVDITTDWVLADLPSIRPTQSGDIVYIACDGYNPRQIERRDNNSWSVVRFYNEGGPFASPPIRDADIVMDPALLSGGTQTITAGRAYFGSAHEYSLIRVRLDDQSKLEHLAGEASFIQPFRVSGANTQDRSFTLDITGTWSGSITGMRSVDGPTTGFLPFTNDSSNVTARTVDDSTAMANIDVWYRYGFRAGEYTSGTAIVSINYGGTDPETPRGYSRIMGPITSTTTVDAEHIGLTSSMGSKTWEVSEWPSPDVTPSANTLFDGRLWWAGLDRLWGSVSDDFTNYDDQTEGDSGPISRSIGIGPIARINWLLPLTRLIVGCEGSEVSVRSSAFDEPVTPTNFTLKECSTQGSANLPALKIDTKGVFVEKSGRRIYELAYDINIQDYRARDLTAFNPDASGGSAFVGLAVQRQPETIMHFIRADGQVAVLVQGGLGDSGVEAWWRVQTLGVVEDIVVLPGTQEDSVYYVVKRTINGSTKRFLEKFALRTQCQGGSLSRNSDCHAVISQASSTTVSGLSHLEGESVKLWANGKDLGSYTVASGAITASEAVTTGIVGLGGVSFSYDSSTAAASVTCATKYNGYPAEVYATGPNGGEMRYVGTVTIASGIATLPNGHTAKKITAYLGFYGLFRSAKLAYGAQMGTALAQQKKIEKIGLIFYDTHYQGITYGSGVDNLQPLPTTEGGVDTAADTVWPEFDEPMIGLSGSWDADNRLHLVGQAPKPATIAAAIIAVTTSEAR